MELLEVIVNSRGFHDTKFDMPMAIFWETRVIGKSTCIRVCPEILLINVNNRLWIRQFKAALLDLFSLGPSDLKEAIYSFS